MDLLYKITIGYNKKYPSGNDPFKIATRLLEECGELAKEVNHFEKTGVKIEKYGLPNRKNFAKEMLDVLKSVLALTVYYGLNEELEELILTTMTKLKEDSYID
jgi:NTP pyrophosphatase (non-canonical NTP hydrolase)